MISEGKDKSTQAIDTDRLVQIIKEANNLLLKENKKLEYYSEKNHLQFYSLFLDTFK